MKTDAASYGPVLLGQLLAGVAVRLEEDRFLARPGRGQHVADRVDVQRVVDGARRRSGDEVHGYAAPRGARPAGWLGRGVSGLTRDQRRVTDLPGFTVTESSLSRLQCVSCTGLVAIDRVGHPAGGDVDVHALAPVAHPEPQPLPARRQLRAEQQLLGAVAHPAEAGDHGQPGAGQRRDVQPVGGVVVAVAQVHQRGLGQVVGGQVEMPDLGGDDGLGAGRQRRVAHGQRLVVVEGARLLGQRERVAGPVQREHEVGLLDHLAAVEVEVGHVQQQRVLVLARPSARSPRPRAR